MGNIRIYGNNGCLTLGNNYIRSNPKIEKHFNKKIKGILPDHGNIIETHPLEKTIISKYIDIIKYMDNIINGLYTIAIIDIGDNWVYVERYGKIKYIKNNFESIEDFKIHFKTAKTVLKKLGIINVF